VVRSAGIKRFRKVARFGVLAALGSLILGLTTGLPGQPVSVAQASPSSTANNTWFTTGSSARDVIVKGGFLYWTNTWSGSIGRANVDGSGVNQNFITGLIEPSGVDVEGSFIYWSSFNAAVGASSIGRANVNGTGVNTSFIAGGTGTVGIEATSTYLYWTNSESDYIGRSNIDGTGVNHTFILTGDRPWNVTANATSLYWSNFWANAIGTSTLAGTGVNQALVQLPASSYPTGVAVDSTYLYWGAYTAGKVGRSSLDGTNVNTDFVAGSGISETVGVEVTATNVYWSRVNTVVADRTLPYFLGRADLDAVAVVPDTFIPVPVTRLLDTRPNQIAAGATRNLTVTGVAGVPTNATAVALNVAAVLPTTGHLRVFPAGAALPDASVLNFQTGKNTPNHVIVKVGASGQISIYAGNNTDVIVDINGYFVGTTAGSTYVPVATRTRLQTITVPGVSSTNVVVAGAGGIGSDAVTAAVDIGALNPIGTGHLRVYPAGAVLPNASTHNFVAGDSRMNLVLVNPGAGGAITIYNASAGAVTITVDTVGFFHPGAGLSFRPVTPVRPLDTRTGGGAPIPAAGFVEVQIRGFATVPNSPSVQAVVVNIAAVSPTATGTVDAGPSGANPTLPWFTHPTNENVANLAIVPVGADGKIRLVNNSAGTSHLIVDITGYLINGAVVAPPAFTPTAVSQLPPVVNPCLVRVCEP
jgi:hypothetical protein